MTEPSSGQAAPEAVPTCYRHPGRETWIRCQRCERPICPDCMISAAVGHQCPNCVKEGLKSTRSGRTAYGGARVANPHATTIGLMVVNVAVWLSVLANGGRDGALLYKLMLTPDFGIRVLEDQSGQIVDGVAEGAWWQVLTVNFTHLEVWHIAMNLFFLWLIGPVVEAPIGRARFLGACLVTGLTTATAVMWLSNQNGATLGFSGIAMGLLGLYAVFALKVGVDRSQLMQLIGFQVIFNVIAFQVVSWQGHLGGFVGGVLAGLVLAYAPKQQRTLVQVGGLVVISIVAIGLIVVRALTLPGVPGLPTA